MPANEHHFVWFLLTLELRYDIRLFVPVDDAWNLALFAEFVGGARTGTGPNLGRECENACREKKMFCIHECGDWFNQICKMNCDTPDILCRSRCTSKFGR